MFYAVHGHVGVTVGMVSELERDLPHVRLDVGVVESPAHEAFHRIHGVFRVGDRLPFGGRPYVSFARPRVDCDNGRRGSSAVCVFNHAWLAGFNDGHARVCRAEVYAEYLGHLRGLLVDVDFSFFRGWGVGLYPL